MTEKELKINFDGNLQCKKKLNIELNLKKVREILLDEITVPFVFVNEDDQEINKDDEEKTILEDVLDGKNINLKKKKIERKILGDLIDTIGNLDIYLFPQIDLSNEKKEYSSNIMVIGETGTGKSTWINALINYLQGIQFEEKIRYNLFDEKKQQNEYTRIYGEKPMGSSVTDVPGVYNIEPTILYDNPIRIVDTAGYGDTRNDENHRYDEKITKDIQTLFESSVIENLNAICLIFKASETRVHERTKYVINKLLSLFGQEVKNNIVIIFTFATSSTDIPAMNTLKDETSPFVQHLGKIENYKYFCFNSKTYFIDNNIEDKNLKMKTEIEYQDNIKNFGSFLKYIFGLNRISLESTKKVIRDRLHIKNNIINLCGDLGNVMLEIKSTLFNRNELTKYQQKLRELEKSKYPLKKVINTINKSEIIEKEIKCDSGWYVLYCKNCNKACHGKCKGSKEGWFSSTYGCEMISTFGSKCSQCNCLDTSHEFKTSYKIKEEKITPIKEENWVEDPDMVKKKEEDDKTKEEMKKKINEYENLIKGADNRIQQSLMNGLNCLYQLALKDDVLNEIALKKDKKYGFTTQILNDNIQKKEKENKDNNKIFNEFMNSLPKIESICLSEETKGQTVKKLKEKLLNN